jgi:hypothetical protein
VTARELRVLRIGVSVCALSLGATRITPGLVNFVVAERHETRELASVLRRQRRAVQSASVLTDSAAFLRQQLERLARIIIPAQSDDQAWEELTAKIGAIARRHEVRIQRVEPLPDSTRIGFLRRITLRAELESDMRGLAEFLGSLDRDSLMIGLSALHVTAPDPQSAPIAPELLRSELRISGWYAMPSHVGETRAPGAQSR